MLRGIRKRSRRRNQDFQTEWNVKNYLSRQKTKTEDKNKGYRLMEGYTRREQKHRYRVEENKQELVCENNKRRIILRDGRIMNVGWGREI